MPGVDGCWVQLVCRVAPFAGLESPAHKGNNYACVVGRVSDAAHTNANQREPRASNSQREPQTVLQKKAKVEGLTEK